jgi:para-aminobenzoate synthetase / 4-amino-4-deoxychorismate lyase
LFSTDGHFTVPKYNHAGCKVKNSPGQNSILLRIQPGNEWLLFEHPVEVVESYTRSELPGTLFYINNLVDSKNLYAAGFLSYEAGAAFDEALIVKHDDHFPLLWFGIYDSIRKPDSLFFDYGGNFPQIKWTPELDYNEYLQNILLIRKHIRKGDTYQVNYTFRLRADFKHDPWIFFNILVNNHDPPFAAFVSTANYSMCSFSPELFFKLDHDLLVSRPMKGTIPRKCRIWDDQAQARTLKNCPKNRAENVMITDMVRNDLGRLADPGSVRVSELFAVEKYPTVWQMISEVRCRTKARIPSILGALFPPASITGAPKASTMSIISSLEISPRRIYTGSIGYIGPGRQSQFNVGIRTVLVNKAENTAEYGVGGGIVWDSTPQSEWDECWTKAKSLRRFNPSFSLLETMLWTPEGGYHLLEAHLNRLRSSAGFFDFKLDIQYVKDRLSDFSRFLPSKCWKIRLLADKKGRISIQKLNLKPLSEPVRLSPAQKPVDNADPFLFHKTTHREVYARAVPVNPDADSVILWNENEQVTESLTANLIVSIDKTLCTPPVSCGLLAGTYRHFLISSGMIRERIIKLEELKRCPDMFLVNSVRGFIRAVMV